MGISLHNLKTCIETGCIKGGGNLTDSPSDSRNQLSVGYDRSRLKSSFYGSFSYCIIVGKCISGIQNHIITAFACQLNICDPAAASSSVSGITSKHIPIKHGGQLFC